MFSGRGLKLGALLGALLLVVAALCSALQGLSERMAVQTFSAREENKPLVVLDAGHGGFDGGATGNGIVEKEINLALAKKTRALCELFGFAVRMTREEDVSTEDPDAVTVRERKRTDLHNRLALMETPGAVAVSLHLNKYPQSSCRGAQVFYGGGVEDGKTLAECIQAAIVAYLQPDNDRQVKKADSALFLLYNNDVNPSVIVECGFLSNPAEAGLLRSAEYQDRLAMAVACALLEFYNRE